MNELHDWIAAQIKERGAVPFADFMGWALYHPELGYYTGERRKFGKEGDFYTSPGINPVFAEVIADELAERLGQVEGDVLTVIEYGAGDGRMARDLLARWKDKHPAFYERVVYRIVEISRALQQRQQSQAGELAEKVVWQSDEELQAAGPFVGAVVTNELIDAFPVHRVVRTEDGVQELYVTWDAEQGALAETTGSLSDERIAEYLARYAKGLRIGQIGEVGLAGLDWYRKACGLLAKGIVLTVDYGFEAEMLYHPTRKQGTLRGFYQHKLTTDPYQHVGEQDLTYDVNVTAVREIGEELGYVTDYFGAQSKFLLQAGIMQRLMDAPGGDLFSDPDVKRNMAIKQLILPGGIGDHFKVLVQSRGMV